MNNNSKKNIAVVIGSEGGIGKSICDRLKLTNLYTHVLGYNRKKGLKIDVTKEGDINKLKKHLIKENYKISLLVNAVGYLHEKNFFPEKKNEDINIKYMKKSFEINTIATALLIKYLAPLMDNKEKSIFASLSAKVGSIEDNYLGGWYSYRISKAALNQLIKTASIEFKRKNPYLIFASIHPGTVTTNLSKPFLGNKKFVSTHEASTNIVNLFRKLKNSDSGFLIDYNYNKIPF